MDSSKNTQTPSQGAATHSKPVDEKTTFLWKERHGLRFEGADPHPCGFALDYKPSTFSLEVVVP